MSDRWRRERERDWERANEGERGRESQQQQQRFTRRWATHLVHVEERVEDLHDDGARLLLGQRLVDLEEVIQVVTRVELEHRRERIVVDLEDVEELNNTLVAERLRRGERERERGVRRSAVGIRVRGE